MLSDQRQLLQLIRAALSPSLVTQAEEAPFNSAVALRGLNTLLGTRVVLWDVNTPFPDIWEDAVFLADDPHAGLLLPCATGRNNFSGKAVLGRDFRPVLPHGTKLHTKTAQLRFPDIFAYFLRTYLKTALQRRVERLSQGSVVELCQLLMALGSQELLPVIQNKLHAWMKICNPHATNNQLFLDRVLDRAENEVSREQISILEGIGLRESTAANNADIALLQALVDAEARVLAAEADLVVTRHTAEQDKVVELAKVLAAEADLAVTRHTAEQKQASLDQQIEAVRDSARHSRSLEDQMHAMREAHQKQQQAHSTEVATLNTRLQAAVTDTDKVQTECDTLRQQYVTVKAEADQLRTEANSLKSEAGQLHTEAKAEADRLRTEANSLKAEADQLRTEAKQQQVAAKAEADQLRTDAMAAREDADRLQSEVVSSKQQQVAAREDADRLQSEVVSTNQEQAAAKAIAEELQSERVSLVAKMESVQRWGLRREEQLTNTTRDRTRMANDLQGARFHIHNLDQELINQKARVAGLEAELKVLSSARKRKADTLALDATPAS